MFNKCLFWSFFFLGLLCILFCIAVCAPCAERNQLGLERQEVTGISDYDACESFGDKSGLGIHELLGGEATTHIVQVNTPSICSDSNLLCFPSTLHAFMDEEANHRKSSIDLIGGSQGDATLLETSVLHNSWESNSSWLAKHGTFTLLNGKMVSCSLNSGMKPRDVASMQGKSAAQSDSDSGGGTSLKYHRPFNVLDRKSELITSDIRGDSSSPNVDISPPFLDWGQSFLYFPSLAYLTVKNKCNESSIEIYKPFSTDMQFYPCDFDEGLLGPGEVARICFVFLPQQLGLLSAHIILQTSSGGFLIHAKGMVTESLYQIQPLVGLNVSLDRGLNKNLSLHNPFDETLYVKEVTASISVSSENVSHSAEAVCKTDDFQGLGEYSSFVDIKEWMDIRSDRVDLPLIALRPHRSWEINPHSTETIVEINFLSGAKGNVFGSFSLEVQSSSQDKADVIVVPLEAEVHARSAYRDFKGSVLVSLESVPCEECVKSIVLSLENTASHLLRFAKISEVTQSTQIFHMKYLDGLLLFPGSVTQIAVITCPLGDSQEPPEGNLDIHLSCKLLVLTNDSGNPQIEIPCEDVIQACSNPQHSHIGYQLQLEKGKPDIEIAGSLENRIHPPSASLETKSEKIAEADELVLRNWKSQGTTRGFSVLEDDELLYPVVQVGSHCSKWISVKNPSERPVFMQLILNSGTIIDQCRSLDNLIEHPLSSILVHNESTRPTKYGFSVADGATAEAFVHPGGKALLGPIIFYPSSRCGWSGSALIRNNLSGVESLSLKGYGGALSLVLVEGSEPIKSIEFNLHLPNPLNVSPQGTKVHKENDSGACSMPLLKEFYAMNTGDLPVEVRKIEVSGTKCGLDGFKVHTCKPFSLEPGESKKLQISYKTDFSAAFVYRDLELALATGNFVFPMKAVLPVNMFSACRKSFFRVSLKKLSLLVLVVGCVMFVVGSFVLPKVLPFSPQECVFKIQNATVRTRNPCVERDQRNSKSSVYKNMISLVKLVRKSETSKLCFVGRFSACTKGVQERKSDQNVLPMQDVQENNIGSPVLKAETELLKCTSEQQSTTLETSCGQTPQSSNLTVRVGKEKSRRRRKRKSTGANTGITGLLEVSSSQSGNSTPSSPMSPIMSFASKTVWSFSPNIDRSVEAGNQFVKEADQSHGNQRVTKTASGLASVESKATGNHISGSQSVSSRPLTSVPKNVTAKPVLLPSASFPSHKQCVPGAPKLSRSTSEINTDCRAPGSNLKDKTIRIEKKTSTEDKFKYDIWGNHLSGIHLMDPVMEVSSMVPNASGGDSLSFFVRGPQMHRRKQEEMSVAPSSGSVVSCNPCSPE